MSDPGTTVSTSDGKMKSDQQSLFKSAKTMGTGASQNVPHGLGRVPVLVLIIPQANSDGLLYDIIEEAHDATNVIVNVTANTEFVAFAW